ncbi:MAG: hypothetical protein WC627_03490 [Legionella sp.]|jgi:hypothetical protein
MIKNDKGYITIDSLDELTPDQRKQVRFASIGAGVLSLLAVASAFLCFGLSPSKNSPLFFYCTDWILQIAVPFAGFCVGAGLVRHLMLLHLGYIVSGYNGGFDTSSPNRGFSSYDSPTHSANNYHSSVSINPASGRPMSGSSGMDISGNPYGSRSW